MRQRYCCHKTLSPASVDKSVHKIALLSKYRTFLYLQNVFAYKIGIDRNGPGTTRYGGVSRNISQKQQFLENDSNFMHHIVNFRTGSAVHGRVMHRCRSWTVFSPSFIMSQLDDRCSPL